ncbi:proteasome subunit beta type-7-like [Limulus polyphemus]|uniref:Proteasome subunit beta n=1 Tax=Limulus polyphemus TaxID=6850 RepID=A0ABM1SWN7_LIMPO|nr:proteasome subunit beta type-7-like [Limulus polyphemus]
MASAVVPQLPVGGFSFENCKRNAFLASKKFPLPNAKKTGTTIVGITYKDGIILGADTRATEDTIVSDKNCSKIHYLAPNMYCCGAGTAADTEMTTKLISSQLELHRLNTGRVVPVCTNYSIAARDPEPMLEEGKVLVRDAIAAGILNDLGSGSNVDLCVITKDGAQHIRPLENIGIRGEKQGSYRYKKGTTAVLKANIIPLDVTDTLIKPVEAEPMDTSG